MKNRFLVGFIGLAIATSALADIQDPPGNDYGPTRKLGRGIGNFLFASTELPNSICNVNRTEGNSAAASYGVVRGLGRSTARHFTGLYEIFTFAAPTHHKVTGRFYLTTFRGSTAVIRNFLPSSDSNQNTFTAATTDCADRFER
jgi:putative exosortase-associated protein (TIGR04073 family)